MSLVEEAEKKGERPYSSISLPAALVREVERVVEELGYWPAKTHFIHEAVLEKVERYRKELEARRRAET
ncbi:MAG: hypothetical protein ACUVUE_07015 [Candidatus Bathycorpusculaceae bacterium]